MTDNAATERRMRPALFWGFIAFMGLLTVLFISLGVWQLNRLGEKQALIAAVTAHSTQPPQPFPDEADWAKLDPAAYDFAPVSLTGHFVPAEAILIFTGLGDDAKGQYRGPGYWVVVPFVREAGGTVLVNRGFVPQQLAETFADDPNTPAGTVAITGLARRPEAANLFTPGQDAQRRIDYVRDPARLSALIDPGLLPLAPLYVDLPSAGEGALPQGGETVINFPNSHFEYAMTWFGFALTMPFLVLSWIWRQKRQKPPKPGASQ
jgi:surfeit locus 1 family protein